MERVVRGMQRILDYLLWKEHQEAELNTLILWMGKPRPSRQKLLGRGFLCEIVAGSWTLISSQGPFGGTRCPFWFPVSRALCPNSFLEKHRSSLSKGHGYPRGACAGPRSQALPVLPPEAV